MKFGKEFTAQMVQEWQQAYMDYNLLKSILKDILIFRQKNTTTQQQPTSSSYKRRGSFYRAFSGLTRHRNSPTRRDKEEISVSFVKQSELGYEEERYQTVLLSASGEGGDKERAFFTILDQEFHKVLTFYKKKVEEVVAEADELTRQMNVLIALRIKVENPNMRAENIPNFPRTQQGHRMEAIQEVEMTSEGHTRRNGQSLQPSEILDHVKINVGPKTPISVLKGMLEHSSSSDLPATKDQLKKAEDLMIHAFVEFYHQLRVLKNYCFMNQLAFAKIMKKYDKITLRHASKSYLDMVDRSYLGSNDEVSKIMKRVEAAFVKHFSDGDHYKAKEILRPKKQRKTHKLTYFLGFLSGCALALVVTILVLIQSRNIINSPGLVQYMNNIFPLYSLFGFIVLHMVVLSANLYYWTRYRINYPFIFNLKEGTELDYRQAFLLSAGLAVLSLAAVISNLDMDMDRRTNNFAALPELVPLILVCVLVCIMICPLNVIYRSTRYFLLTALFHCFLAPFYKVTLPDFFMADQLTSQVQAFRSVQFYVCYYIWGNFRQRNDNNCQTNSVYQIFYIIVAIIPFWLRMLQCIRRLVEEKGAKHAFDALKFLSIMIALSARTLQVQRGGGFLMIVAAAASGIATIYVIYWDIIIDWGLLQRNSKNRWLRDKLILPNKRVYFIAIVLNCLLRLAWMQTVLGFTQAPYIHRKAMIALVACLEIIRRGIWNFFRLENEHLNNVGKYRAFNSVPLPFYYAGGAKHGRSRA